MKKRCISCHKIKSLEDFHKHSEMKDGHLNKCKPCVRKYVSERVAVLSKDPTWLLKERERQRKKEAKRRNEGRVRKETPEEARKRTTKWRLKHAHKRKAHCLVNSALRNGALIAKPCHCGAKAQAHHDDYGKPLEVDWLCPKHHAERHVELRNKQLLIA